MSSDCMHSRMDQLADDFRKLRFSALSKCKQISPYVHDVTIGPGCASKNRPLPRPTTKEEATETTFELKEPLRITINNATPFARVMAKIECDRQESVQEAVSVRRTCIDEFTKQRDCERAHRWLKQQQMLVARMQQEEAQFLQALEQPSAESSERDVRLEQHYTGLAEARKRHDREVQAKEQVKNVIAMKLRKELQKCREAYEKLGEGIDMNITRKLQELEANQEEASIAVLTKASQLLAMLTAAEMQPKKQEAFVVPPPLQPQPLTPPSVEQHVVLEKIPDLSPSRYEQLQYFLQTHEASYYDLLHDNTFKQFRFNCKKAINIPVNSISGVSSKHLAEKHERLANLLSGNVVHVGDNAFSAREHPQGVAFCEDLLAKQFVLQADLTISSNPQAAFCYASVMVALWDHFPSFGKLLLAHFYQQCPYLTPVYPARLAGQSDVDHYKMLGYQYSEGTIEKQDQFLKRMTGLMWLYSSVLRTKSRGSAKQPHGIVHGWRWLASFLNLEPRMDITATMLHVFLENVGTSMQAIYKKQFHKVMAFIAEQYLPVLQKIDSGGPFTRLEMVVLKYQACGCFTDPKGTPSSQSLATFL